MQVWETIRPFLEAAVAIFAIVNPIGSLPFLIGLTYGATPQQRKRLVRVAGMTALAIVVAIAVAGDFLLKSVFQVSINEFAFGGGLLLIVVGIRSILSEEKSGGPPLEGQEADMRKVIIAVSPIACPLLVGPGTIVTTMLIVSQHGVLYALGACLTAFVFVILILNYSHVLFRVMGTVVTVAVGRIMDIFIVAIGVRFMFNAVIKIFPALMR